MSVSSPNTPSVKSPLDESQVRASGIVPTADSDDHVVAAKGKDWLSMLDIQRLPPYLVISNALGFRERFSLFFFIVFGGALVGFALARSQSLNPNNFHSQLVLGEAFWATREPWKGLLTTHIVLSFGGSILVILEFIPAILRNYMTFHRINGYVSLVLLFPAILTGSIVGRQAFGGEISDQTGFYVLGILSGYYGFEGMRTVHEIRQHRRWMLRFASLLGVIITARLITLCAGDIITDIGSYYALWKCDELLYVLKKLDAYPTCLAAQQARGNLAQVQVPIHASNREGGLHKASVRRVNAGMTIWVALVIHMIGSEIYIRATERANRQQAGFILGRPRTLPEEQLDSSDR